SDILAAGLRGAIIIASPAGRPGGRVNHRSELQHPWPRAEGQQVEWTSPLNRPKLTRPPGRPAADVSDCFSTEVSQAYCRWLAWAKCVDMVTSLAKLKSRAS